MMSETTKPEIYSYLPCPKGCSLSAGLSANLKPNNVATDEPASDKLFNASAVMDTECVITPAKNFTVKSMTLHMIPTYPLNMPYFFLISSSVVLDFIKWFKSFKRISFICGRCPHLPTFPPESWTKNFNFCERSFTKF